MFLGERKGEENNLCLDFPDLVEKRTSSPNCEFVQRKDLPFPLNI